MGPRIVFSFFLLFFFFLFGFVCGSLPNDPLVEKEWHLPMRSPYPSAQIEVFLFFLFSFFSYSSSLLFCFSSFTFLSFTFLSFFSLISFFKGAWDLGYDGNGVVIGLITPLVDSNITGNL